jgi:hypothetical protein
MPSLPDPTPPENDSPAAVPPVLAPELYERHEGFRETTLAYFTEPEDNAALRHLGQLLYGMALESIRYWPTEPEGAFVQQGRAVVADLRHLQGTLYQMDRERVASSLTEREDSISVTCGRLTRRVKAIADSLEAELAKSWDEEDGEAE